MASNAKQNASCLVEIWNLQKDIKVKESSKDVILLG